MTDSDLLQIEHDLPQAHGCPGDGATTIYHLDGTFDRYQHRCPLCTVYRLLKEVRRLKCGESGFGS